MGARARGLGVCEVLGVRRPGLALTGDDRRLSRSRVGSGQVGSGSAGRSCFWAGQPASAGDITPPSPEPPPLLSPRRLLSRPGSALPRPSPPICGGGDSLSVISLSRFLGIGLGSSPDRGETAHCLAVPHSHTCHRYTLRHSRAHAATASLAVTLPYSHSQSSRHYCTREQVATGPSSFTLGTWESGPAPAAS